MLQKIYISNKCSLELSIYQKKKKNLVPNIVIQNHILLFQNQHIRMISEGSRDTEDWSNDAENSALPSEKYFIFKILI